ncbi:hypothetical protein [Empedobacter brevis]|uniref:hypothetical protein n=1 Tax=Empedobacter brevis TaxID=247 RepID=UPI0028997767|nr:hypothetical protein [Empedobacter brevis]
MKIETKYDRGEKVYILIDQQILTGTIEYFRITHNFVGITEIIYHINPDDNEFHRDDFFENNVYKTPFDIIKSFHEKHHFNLQFKSNDKVIANLTGRQSPRGVRYEEKRPNTVLIDCYEEFNELTLSKHIEYLNEISLALEKVKL